MRYKFISEKRQHLHTLDDKPLKGTTTVISEVYPPPLAWWGARLALEPIGFTTDKIEPDEAKRLELASKGQNELIKAGGLTVEEYYAWLTRLYRNHDEYKKSKGKEGVDMHAQIEAYINTCLKDHGGKPFPFEALAGFSDWAMRDVEHFIWSEAHCYSERLWVGGITDFGFAHKNGGIFVGDNKPSIYPKHFYQTAGYGIQIKENGLFDAEGNSLPNIVTIGAIDGYCIFDYNKGVPSYLSGIWVAKLERMFEHTVEAYDMKDLKGSPTLQ